ncbi:TetR/AcrR family transcriptional regulator C-terminal domain-containing protein [Kitasatospora sp. NBC_01287]|uniref:TetR/AcrR family transcriptional regulator n=1 Tax=Kitasatospora sp. NBC_01287 TaxID=2903573 RepID=UPI00224D6F08|nr:TetR/AcrR family transcriptional regulator C-terminal domain-containing protein [Kitasatospora sp. NBC_01287]MCX4750276.1 TetR/AcrR family transcriptional regulator C-terminal domain-containing protein [Kitasatospora sp. NBC_01287]
MTSEMPAIPWHKARKADTRQPLTPEAIVEAGIAVLDREGLEGLTMRRVAQELGTGPASLYAHVSNKDELLELMLERISGEIRLPARPEPERWKEQIKEICREAQRVYTAHRDIAVVSLGGIHLGPNKLRISEFMLALMLSVDIPRQVAAWALDGLGQLVDTDAYEASVYTAKFASGVGIEGYFEGVRDYFAQLPEERFPLFKEMAQTLVTGDGDDRFEFKLDVFLRGLETYIER